MSYDALRKARKLFTSPLSLTICAPSVGEAGIIPTTAALGPPNLISTPALSPLENFLLSRSVNGIISDFFDENFYLTSYPDAASYPRRPLRHYIEIGQSENRVRTDGELRYRRERVERSFDYDFYKQQLQNDLHDHDLLNHFLLYGVRMGLAPCPELSIDYYLRLYPDLDGMPLDPFQHYIQFGKSEVRSGILEYTKLIQDAHRSFDKTKKTIFLGLHDGSRTGAPLLGLLLADRLSKTYNIIGYLFNDGPIIDDLKEVCCLLVSPCHIVNVEFVILHLMKSYAIEYVLYNSIEAGQLAEVALNIGLPCVGLIHEFSEYTKPRGRMVSCAELTDRVIVPAKLLAASLQREATSTRSSQLNNICVQPQGRLPRLPPDRHALDLSADDLRGLMGVDGDENCKIVLGAGHVQIRKGVDLFIQTASKVAARWNGKVRFLWIGSGYEPERDLHYSVWLADMLARLQLENTCYFISPQSSLDSAFAISDVFFLSSRLDPFPNVVLDALHANKPVVCFKDATGVATLFEDGRAGGAAAPFCEVEGAADAIIRLFKKDEPLRNKELVEREFDFDKYAQIIQRELILAGAKKSRVLDISERLTDDNRFDLSFCEGRTFVVAEAARKRAIRKYVARGQNGVSWTSPHPGFNEGAHRAAHGKGLEERVYGGNVTTPAAARTHNAIDLDKAFISNNSSQKVAIHIHIFYADLAEEFRDRLDAVKSRANLFITTSSDENELKIKQCFKNYQGGEVKIFRVNNRGRDIAPMILEILPLLIEERYDVFAHLHGKKSLAVSESFGTQWREFSLRTLIGNVSTMSKILGMFGENKRLGLVFPEERYAIGWTQNKQFGNLLACKLKPPLELPPFPIFPIGTMFWARPPALQSLLDLGLTEADFPSEPLPYDGTMLHAIERMLPSFCERRGFEWLTVFRRGISR